MKMISFSKVQHILSILMALFFLYGAYEIDRYAVEEMFKEMHPDLDRLNSTPWVECDNLDEQSLERICLQVLSSLNITKRYLTLENFTYVPPSKEQPLQVERVIRGAPVKFQHIKEYTAYMTLIRCYYREMDMYLAKGDDECVFRLSKDPEDNTFYFKSGTHSVNFTNT